MFNNGKVNLKFSKKRSQWENSTQSCTISVNESEKDYYKAYSYREVIFYYEEKINKWVFNYYKFSPTTSSHQYALSNRLSKFTSGENILYGHFITLNNGLDYNKLETSEDNLQLVETYFPEKLESFKQAIIEKNQEIKDEKNKRAKIKKIERIQYSNKKTMIKAMESINYGKTNYKYSLDIFKALELFKRGFNKKEIENYFSFPGIINITGLFHIEKNHSEFLDSFKDLNLDLKICRWNRLEVDFLNYLKEKNLLEKFIEENYLDVNKKETDYISEAEKSLKEYLILQGLKDLI